MYTELRKQTVEFVLIPPGTAIDQFPGLMHGLPEALTGAKP